jgi:lipoprotein-anchoring transpeptidase ErfK/SrfK
MNRFDFMRRPIYSNTKSEYMIIVNTCTRKLHLIKDKQLYRSYPIAVGKMLRNTKPGVYRILCKDDKPGGRYGARWMGLNKKHYSIHGTDDPFSIGKPVSHGCIRMYNRDVIELFDMVDIDTRVRIV